MNNLYMSSAPHIHTKESVSGIMLDVLIALMPASLWGIFRFGYRAAIVLITAIAACVMFEFFTCKVMKKASTVGDLSAMVTGLLLGLNMPVSIPLWMVVVGSGFGIIVVKMLYGGLGKNFVNPALAARCFMLIAWTGAMTTFGAGMDAVSSATPLAVMKGAEGELPSVLHCFIGMKDGCIGEVSGLALLIGFVYLLIKKVIKADISLSFIITFFVLTFLFGKNVTDVSQMEYTVVQLLTGGVLLGAFFMATDYVTTPTTKKGHIIFGFGCGLLTFLIRQFGGYPEGTSYAILLMNVASPLIENYTVPKPFGYRKERN